MIGLIALLILVSWISICIYLARRLPRWIGVVRHSAFISTATFFVLFTALGIQDIVGLWQFDRLCSTNAVVWVGPNAREVKRAFETSPATKELLGYWIRIREQRAEYSDADTGKPFLSEIGFHTKGGLIVEMLSLGNVRSCWPKANREVFKELDIDNLLAQGKLK